MIDRFTGRYDGMPRRIVRLLTSAYLLTWLLGAVLSVFHSGYEVSEEIASYSWEFFSAASIVDIMLVWAGSLSVFFQIKWSRWLFLANISYGLIYILVFGEGGGSRINMVIGSVHIMLAGAILSLLFLAHSNQLAGNYEQETR